MIDWQRLQEIFEAQGFDYTLPPESAFLESSTFVADGQIQMAILARPTVELYMLSDKGWGTPGMRFLALRAVHEDMRKKLVARGIQDAHVWLPPEVERPFGSRLRRSFQWAPSRWKCYERGTQ